MSGGAKYIRDKDKGKYKLNPEDYPEICFNPDILVYEQIQNPSGNGVGTSFEVKTLKELIDEKAQNYSKYWSEYLHKKKLITKLEIENQKLQEIIDNLKSDSNDESIGTKRPRKYE